MKNVASWNNLAVGTIYLTESNFCEVDDISYEKTTTFFIVLWKKLSCAVRQKYFVYKLVHATIAMEKVVPFYMIGSVRSIFKTLGNMWYL